jgi:hypothetical protein
MGLLCLQHVDLSYMVHAHGILCSDCATQLDAGMGLKASAGSALPC